MDFDLCYEFDESQEIYFQLPEEKENLRGQTQDVLGATEDSSAKTENPLGEAEDPELEEIKAQVKEMEEETERLKKLLRNQIEKLGDYGYPGVPQGTWEVKVETDARSIYVGNVDYGATEEDIMEHFGECGVINRITLPRDKYSGCPKGFAYIEFADKDSLRLAEALDTSLFCGRQIKVSAKRTNTPGISTTNRPLRGLSFRGTRRFSNHRGRYGPVKRYSRGNTWGYPY